MRVAAARPVDDLSGLVPNWTFTASAPRVQVYLSRWRSILIGVRPAPPAGVVRPLFSHDRWNGYFLFLPDGQLSAAHRFTLARLRQLRGKLAVVCAAPAPDRVPADLRNGCDALFWKGTSGYDFSAYSLLVREVAARSPGADLLLMNDSVLGPFDDLDTVLAGTRWQLTGFTAWSAFENHVQTYALLLKGVTPELVAALRSVLCARVAFNRFQDVVNWQETRLARCAARAISVGALWFEPRFDAGDPSIVRAVPLLRAGFPFVKRSLAGGKLVHRADLSTLRDLLAERGHPTA